MGQFSEGFNTTYLHAIFYGKRAVSKNSSSYYTSNFNYKISKSKSENLLSGKKMAKNLKKQSATEILKK